MVAGISEGRYTEARLDESVRRVLQLKRNFDLEHRKFVNLDSLRMIVGDSSHLASARKVAERSITLVKDSLVVNSSQGGGSKDTWVLSQDF